MTEVLTISGGSERVCVDVPITDDNIVEFNETFHVVLSTTDEAVVLDVEKAQVFITNDDSESRCVTHDDI